MHLDSRVIRLCGSSRQQPAPTALAQPLHFVEQDRYPQVLQGKDSKLSCARTSKENITEASRVQCSFSMHYDLNVPYTTNAAELQQTLVFLSERESC